LIAHWALSWVLLLGLWLSFVGAVDRAETVIGALAAAVAATAAGIVRAQGLLPSRVERAWVRRMLRVPADTVVQFSAVVGALLRREPPRGRLQTVPFTPRGSSGSRALAAWADTISPNDYVVEIEEGEAAKHVLERRSEDRVL
jgi:hypothetical protein